MWGPWATYDWRAETYCSFCTTISGSYGISLQDRETAKTVSKSVSVYFKHKRTMSREHFASRDVLSCNRTFWPQRECVRIYCPQRKSVTLVLKTMSQTLHVYISLETKSVTLLTEYERNTCHSAMLSSVYLFCVESWEIPPVLWGQFLYFVIWN